MAMILLRSCIFTLLVPGSVTIGIPHLLLSSGSGHGSAAPGASRALGAVPIIAGAACYLWCAWAFTFVGRGTPGPWDAPRRFVARGVYRIVRNPMYAGIVLVLLGEAIVFASWGLLLYALLLWGAFSLTVVGYEEPALREQFGDDYEAYSRAVPRWIPCRQRAQRRG